VRSTVLHESIDTADFVSAFPSKARQTAEFVVSDLPPTTIKPKGRVPVWLEGENLFLPYRIYNETPDSPLDGLPGMIRDCLYSGHHDGHVRESSIGRAIKSGELMVVPFVFLLLGGYPIEIHQTIEESLDASSLGDEEFEEFAANNHEFMALTEARALSYHSAYYRSKAKADYPALRLLDRWASSWALNRKATRLLPPR